MDGVQHQYTYNDSSMIGDENMPPPLRDNLQRCSASTDIRKVNKPLMEKRRRERINRSLDQLKSLLMEYTKKENSYYSKLEKADILELTVKYLKNVRRDKISTTPAVTQTNSTLAAARYTTGFIECKDEVIRFLGSVKGMSPEVHSTLLGHLTECLPSSSKTQPPLSPSTTVLSANQTNIQRLAPSQPSSTSFAIAQPNTVVTSYPLQLVPAQLPSGDIILVLANSNHSSNVTTCIGSGVRARSAVLINEHNNNNNVNMVGGMVGNVALKTAPNMFRQNLATSSTTGCGRTHGQITESFESGSPCIVTSQRQPTANSTKNGGSADERKPLNQNRNSLIKPNSVTIIEGADLRYGFAARPRQEFNDVHYEEISPSSSPPQPLCSSKKCDSPILFTNRQTVFFPDEEMLTTDNNSPTPCLIKSGTIFEQRVEMTSSVELSPRELRIDEWHSASILYTNQNEPLSRHSVLSSPCYSPYSPPQQYQAAAEDMDESGSMWRPW